ncbi:lipopolysaccharide biosynthesis protein [Aquirufa echingensis]|uniref:Oligosaccharide flippase family protein n=1 Tax=Aquirufa echingensis TaxID=3096516 RepID=A0ABW6D361_9BACT
MSNNPSYIKHKIEELFKHGIVYGLTSSLQNVLGFIMLPLLTNYFTPEIFGVYSILLLLSSLTSSIFYLGASSALGRFYFDEDSDLFRKKIITSALIVTTFGAGMLISTGFVISNSLSLYLFRSIVYSKPILFILIATAFSFLLNLMTLLLRYEKKSFHFFLIIILGVLLNFISTYFLLSKLNLGLLAPIYSSLFSNIICFSVILFTRINLLTKKVDVKLIKVVLNFGIQSSLAGLLFYVLEWVDRLIIKDLLNLNDVGIYSLGYRLGSIMNVLLIMPLNLVWGPMRMQNLASKQLNDFSSKVVSYYTIVGVMIVVFSILFGPDILQLIFKNKSYTAAYDVFPIIMFSLFFYGYQNIVDFGIYLHKKVYFYILISIFGICINVILNYWLIPLYGYLAAAYVTLVTYITTSLLIYFISNSYFRIKIEPYRVVVALIYPPIVFGLISYLGFNNIILKSLIGLISLYYLYKYWLNENERIYVGGKFRMWVKYF